MLHPQMLMLMSVMAGGTLQLGTLKKNGKGYVDGKWEGNVKECLERALEVYWEGGIINRIWEGALADLGGSIH